MVLRLVARGCQTPGTGQNADGVRYFQEGQSQAAVYQFQQALAANPTNADAYYNLAAAYHYLGKQNGDTALLEQSENLYHQCLDLSPDHVACHRALAVLLVDTNRPQSAFTLAGTLVDTQPAAVGSTHRTGTATRGIWRTGRGEPIFGRGDRPRSIERPSLGGVGQAA